MKKWDALGKAPESRQPIVRDFVSIDRSGFGELEQQCPNRTSSLKCQITTEVLLQIREGNQCGQMRQACHLAAEAQRPPSYSSARPVCHAKRQIRCKSCRHSRSHFGQNMGAPCPSVHFRHREPIASGDNELREKDWVIPYAGVIGCHAVPLCCLQKTSKRSYQQTTYLFGATRPSNCYNVCRSAILAV